MTATILRTLDFPGDGRSLWSVDPTEKALYQLAADGKVLGKVSVPEGTEPHGLTWDGSSVWSDDERLKKIHQIQIT